MTPDIDLDEWELQQLLDRLADASDPPTSEEIRRMAAAAVASSGDLRSRRRVGSRSRSPILVSVAAAVLVLGTVAATAYVLTEDPPAPPGLEAAVTSVFSDGRCVGADEATGLIREELGRLGYPDWQVIARPGAAGQRCVVAGLDTADRQIVLVPVEQPGIAASMQAVREHLMAECLDQDQARELIGSTLMSLGVTEWDMRTGGPVTYPAGDSAALREHISEGCTVITASGHDADGELIYYVSGG